jgi:SAM-dependent methyltransferase
MYGEQFQTSMRGGASRSAQVIAPLLYRAFKPRKVIDVGCGSGEWLAAFLDTGVEEILGVDGAYVPMSSLAIPPDRFHCADLREALTIGAQFDLVVCLEVAEHLPPERSEGLIADLISLGPVIAFSAAVPGQGGVDHINLRWQSDWARMFAAQGYRWVDVVRPHVWERRDVEYWYSQNLLVYTEDSRATKAVTRLPLDVVHPRCLELQVSEYRAAAAEFAAPLGGRRAARELASALFRRLWRFRVRDSR